MSSLGLIKDMSLGVLGFGSGIAAVTCYFRLAGRDASRRGGFARRRS